ncbi:MAG: transporter [Deltaproteobacteria bacterium]|nr:transporter [Deltaproteobacteria bacterium]
MNKLYQMKITLLALLVFTLGYTQKAFALGECGLSCCIAGATTSGATLATRFGLSVQYENTYMETLREGNDSISPDTVLDRKAAEWPMMPMETKSFSVPTEMRMQKLTILATYPATERWQFLAIIPFVKNEMDMRKLTRDTMGMDMIMNMTMDTVEGLGDITLMGLYTAYTDAPIRPNHRLTLGLGIKTPTGENDERTASGTLVHTIMQPGTGSWDPLFLVNYMRAFYPLVLQANLFYHLTTEGDEGYEFGDQMALDLIARYQVANYVSLGLEINGLYARKDKDHDNKYSRPETSMIDNTANTGIKSIYITPAIQVKFPGTGASAELKFQKPIYQDANGIQQVVDWRVLASFVYNF